MPRTTRPAAPKVFAPAALGSLTLRNRIIKAATFEGVMPGGTVSDELIEFHRRVAAGGAAMSTVAYLAVSPEGRTDRHCLLLSKENLPGLRRLTDAIHAEGAAAAAQIGHAGPVANARSNRAPALSASGGFTPMGSRLRAIDAAGIERVVEDYRAAASRAVEAGFDSIEVHVGHNYLLSAFLSPKLNKRHDQFGGSVENRARFARTVLRTVRDAVGDKTAVTAKLNMADGVDGGLWLDESVQVATLFESDGTLDALELTGGSSLTNPMYLFRGDAPLREFGATLPQPVRLGFRLIGRRFLRTYPYEEGFFLPFARQFLAALHTPVILLGGITELATIESALDEGFAFVAMARALLREPDLPNRMQAGTASSSLCIHCNKCMPTIYSGTRCVLVSDRPGSA
ncbi:MAG TPA: NADH:flavin oxidoreductase [Acidimicrobiales bacterium]|jgi:2,4-dienoyl-CoA reductase-like NADH-dependent reductase (Old Yellow Enzyme family)|nr:NADH:flavin oxidoreductase [Acidimicrobiales bacterium]